MKLLTKPSSTREIIEWNIPARRETRFNPLGIFGIGPITTMVYVPARTGVSSFRGRNILDKVEIDFEDEDAINLCIEVGAYDMIKKKTEFTLAFEGEVYIIHGVIPEKLLRDNIWSCNIDHFEY